MNGNAIKAAMTQRRLKWRGAGFIVSTARGFTQCRNEAEKWFQSFRGDNRLEWMPRLRDIRIA